MIDIREENWLAELLPRVVTLARDAGKAILKVYCAVNPEVTYKPDNSPLTQADIASHHVILDGLAQLAPEWPALSEESAETPFELRKSWKYFWMVDPLDGTKEFLRQNGEFTVNIALIEFNIPILGVVYAPAIDKLYFAARMAGAYKVDRGITSRIKATSAAKTTTRVVVSRSHRAGEEDLDGIIGAKQNCEFIVMGSSLKFCLVAEGAADVYPRAGPTTEWDTAAAQCILEEAGGSVSDLDGNSMNYNKPALLNPGFLARGMNGKGSPDWIGANARMCR